MAVNDLTSYTSKLMESVQNLIDSGKALDQEYHYVPSGLFYDLAQWVCDHDKWRKGLTSFVCEKCNLHSDDIPDCEDE
jgi:hypothetical protein